jgi:hypothetical protein
MGEQDHSTVLLENRLVLVREDSETYYGEHYFIEETVDKQPRLWALYKPTSLCDIGNDAPLHLWIRRFDLYITEEAAKQALNERINGKVLWRHHELFPELQIGVDDRGFRWLLEPVPILL